VSGRGQVLLLSVPAPRHSDILPALIQRPAPESVGERGREPRLGLAHRLSAMSIIYSWMLVFGTGNVLVGASMRLTAM
jgi:hypothetical protein